MYITPLTFVCLIFACTHLICHVIGTKEDFVSDRDCPFLCTCHEYDVNCSNTNIFPEGIPKMTERFFLANSTISFVPINAFLDLPFLQEVHFINCNITKLRACSFAELANMTKISFESTSIDQIEGNAFSNLDTISLIQFSRTTIGEMYSYSFQNVQNVERIDFFETKISTIHPLALKTFTNVEEIGFLDSSVQRFLVNGFSSFTNISTMYMSGSVLHEWQCGSLNAVLASGTDIDITRSSFVCDCKLAWLWTNHSNHSLFNDAFSNKCKNTNQVISRVNIDQSCFSKKPRDQGCPPWVPSPPHTCSRSFDSPMNPVEKVTYPAFFTRSTPSSAPSFSYVYVNIMLTVFFTKSCQWVLK